MRLMRGQQEASRTATASTHYRISPAASVIVATKQATYPKIAPIPLALVVFAFAFAFLGAIWGYVACLVAIVPDAAGVVLYAVDAVAVLEASCCPRIKRTDLLLN